jgi:nucleoside-diphosphate-sugar epimerase
LRPTAILLARETNTRKIPAFVYISAAAGAPVLPARYITTKRAAESTISSAFPSLRAVFLRPGFLYDSSRAFTMPLAALTALGAMANSVVGGRLTYLMGAGGTKPLKADDVAAAVVEAVEDASVKGPVEVPAIEVLAQKAWRKGMA